MGQNLGGSMNLGGSFKSNYTGGDARDEFLTDKKKFGIIPRSIEHLFNGLERMMY